MQILWPLENRNVCWFFFPNFLLYLIYILILLQVLYDIFLTINLLKSILIEHTAPLIVACFFFQDGKDGYADMQLSCHNENETSKHHTLAA